jgi:hypothetical protein
VTGRRLLPALLLVVAGAAAVLSFAALRDLALVCGFSPQLAWLLPVVVDAGAAAGSLVWLGETTAETARLFARGLALGLLALSVAANALGHGLAAFGLAPPWWVVVTVSAVAPAVLGAVVHLAVLVGRDGPPPAEAAGADVTWPDREPAAGEETSAGAAVPTNPEAAEPPDRAAELIAGGAGRRRLSRELGVTEYEARQLLARGRPPAPGPGSEPAPDADDLDLRVLTTAGRPE